MCAHHVLSHYATLSRCRNSAHVYPMLAAAYTLCYALSLLVISLLVVSLSWLLFMCLLDGDAHLSSGRRLCEGIGDNTDESIAQ